MISMDRAHLYWAYLKARADDSAVFIRSSLGLMLCINVGLKKILPIFVAQLYGSRAKNLLLDY